MANMHLVTGFAGREHVTSIDQGLLNSYIIGDVEAVMKRGNQFEASIISNNIIRVKDGDLLMQGRFARLNDDSYVDLAIENGTQGYFRNDLIVARYQKDAITAVETVDLVVIKGENAASDPADPAHVKGDIKSGKDFVNDVPLWRVSLEGLSVTGLTCLYSTFSASLTSLLEHCGDSNNPHKVTAAQIGAAASSHTHTPASIGAAKENHVHSGADITTGLDTLVNNLSLYGLFDIRVLANNMTITTGPNKTVISPYFVRTGGKNSISAVGDYMEFTIDTSVIPEGAAVYYFALNNPNASGVYFLAGTSQTVIWELCINGVWYTLGEIAAFSTTFAVGVVGASFMKGDTVLIRATIPSPGTGYGCSNSHDSNDSWNFYYVQG